MRRDHDPRRAVQVRDQASRRVKRLTTTFVAGATLLTAAFAGIAAGSTHTTKKIVQRVTRTPASTHAKTVHAKTVTAPTPALVPNGSTATPSAPQQQAQPQTQVAPSASPPVVVGGGS